MIRIVRLIARLNVGGPAQHVVWLTRGLDSRGYETTLATGQVDLHEEEFDRLLDSEGIRPWRISGLGRAIRPLADLGAWIEIVRLLGRRRPRIVHTHTAKAGALGRLAVLFRILLGYPRPIVVHTFHGHVFEGYFGWLGTRVTLAVERLLARFTDTLIVLSPAQQFDLVERFRIAPQNRIRIVPLGIDLDPFLGVKPRRRGSGETPRVGWIGRLVPVKAPDRLLQAARLYPEARFVLAGDGLLRESLSDTIASTGLQDRVELLGAVDDVPSFLASIDVLVLTSINEGTPVGILEAFAVGVPVVAPAVGGIPDLLDQGRGIVVPPDDAASLTSSIRALLDDPERARTQAERAREYVLEHHGLEALLGRIDTLYRDLERKRSDLSPPA